MTEEEKQETAPEHVTEEIEALEKTLLDEKAKAEKYLANWQRSEADLINYKRHSEQEREETKQYANATLVLNILPFLDDMDRAFAAVPPKLKKDGWVEGVQILRRKLDAILEQQGLSPIAALGEPFDPRVHEAVGQCKGKDGVVLQEMQKGYTLRGRVIRASKVMVGNGEKE